MTTVFPPAEDGSVRQTTASPWTPDDRVLMLAWRSYQNTLCSGCGFPIAQAWHEDNDGWYEGEPITCHACTAREAAGDDSSGKPVQYVSVKDTRDYESHPLPPWSSS